MLNFSLSLKSKRRIYVREITLVVITVVFAAFLGVTYIQEGFTYTGIHYGGYLIHGGVTYIVMVFNLIAWEGMKILKKFSRKARIITLWTPTYVVASLNEAAQLYQPGRVFDWWDITNQTIGAVIALIFLLSLKEKSEG